MKTQKIKTMLIAALGNNATAYIQALRFIYLLKKSTPDPEVNILCHLLNEGDIAVDIGANGANWTYYLHQHVGSGGMVFAFEADPYYALATDLTIKFLRLEGIKFFKFGLSNKNEDTFLRIADEETHNRYSGLGYIDKNAKKNDKNVVYVQLKKLDSVLDDHKILFKTNLIKCDVEGYELFVFQGAEKILKKARPFVILETGNFCRHGYSANELYNFFAEMQYSCFCAVGNNKISETDSMMNQKNSISVNRLLIPKEKIDSIQNLIQPNS